ncbi:uncharacterized protein LOC129911654 [Episyrphus balteatus]|uniref:uncharacterized protein LOC129911654 n=1 Tax=Episyrphus balteatus TaxID=286459 RepID=UPI0024851CAE|nr:uncharacterized protein LOC129911654 [Episyrphus balteatus]
MRVISKKPTKYTNNGGYASPRALVVLNIYGVNSIDVLEKMETKDVDKLFANIDSAGFFGERVKFKAGLRKWQKERNKPLLCDQGTPSPPSTRKVIEWLEKISNDLNAPSSRASSHSRVAEETDLLSVLRSSVRGKMLLSYYEQNGQLNSKNQKVLTHCIVERFVGCGTKMSYRDMNLWANAIVETFPTENKVSTYLPVCIVAFNQNS